MIKISVMLVLVSVIGFAIMHRRTDAPQARQIPQSRAQPLTQPPHAPAEVPTSPANPDDDIVETRHTYSGPRRPQALHSSTPTASSGKVAYLTFDDGPSGSTRKILSILRTYGVPATFFVVGSDSAEGRALYQQIAAEGHALGNHTYSHDYKAIYRSTAAFRKDVDKLGRLLESCVGYRPDIIRFPGGSNNHLSWKSGGRGIMYRAAKAVQDDGYQYFDWNVSSTDAAAPVQDKSLIIDSVMSASRGKQSIIVLMHDNTYKTTTVEALPVIIKRLQAAGFTFGKLSKNSFAFHFLEP
ncbi:polysaccharide deacetylase family protein [Paenibacillus aestuarii]|uniref:Polysaccharide deacetylase family protein n=1 Tax=Paenibacillus aestuarii TaxID=516965 RepID=A0ABW0KDD3_9BACL|nr:polysaccharide deacetylase family protein [Paenibacillus aestuarii]